MERNNRPNVSGCNLTQDQPDYDLPVSNIAYHVYTEDTRAEDKAVAQRAFQRIMDSYEDYEKLTDVFQVELDRRQQLADERKQHEKLLKEERLRRQKEERKNRRLGKSGSSAASNRGKTPQQLSSSSLSSSRTAAALAYHPYRHASQNAAAAISLTDLGRGPSLYRAFGGYGHDYTQGSIFATTSSDSHSHSHPGHDHPPHLIQVTSAPSERSPSGSPVLPLTPSPQLGTSDAALGSLTSASGASFSASSSTSATPFSISGSVSSFAASAYSGAQPQRMHKKRKQGIPVHPSVVDRIPGITLRIQPTAEQHLQVEILKDLDDYRPVRSTISENEREMDSAVDVGPNDGEHMGRSAPAHDESSSEINGPRPSTLFEARQDLDKVRESIESGRPGYGFFPSTYNQQLLQRDAHCLPESSSVQDMETSATASASTTSGLGHLQKHQRQSSSSSGRSFYFYDPTGVRLSAADHHQRPFSTSTDSLAWPQQPYDLFGMPMAPVDVEAARAAASPLSWDNFSTRDCQVNKVIGKHDKDFELLEEVVQEAIARQHAAQQAAEESDDQSQGKPRRRRGSRQLDREDSETSARSTPAATSTKPTGGRGSSKANSGSKASRVAASLTAGAHATRGGATELVQTYDDIERILKERRLKKKREAKRRQESLVADAYHEDEQDHMEQLDQDKEGDDDDQDGPGLKTEDSLEPDDLVDTSPQKQMSSRRRKSLSLLATRNDDGQAKRIPPSKLNSQLTSPPSPPHSRQVTPSKGDSTATSRRSSISSHVRHQTNVNAAPGSNTSGTPPATPTRANAPLPPLFSSPQEESPVSGGRRRRRSRSVSISTPIASMEGKNKNSFFDSALEQIEAKRRQKLAKKKAAAAVAALEASEQRNENGHATQDTSEANIKASDAVDPHALERELCSLKSSEAVDASKGNLPKSSKFLPGRVLRTTRTKTHDPLYLTDVVMGASGLGVSSSMHGIDERDHHPRDENATGEDLDVDLLDPDCASCRLALNGFDKQSWKRTREAGDIYLNPKQWGKTSILCIACRLQYQKHHLRCTQCFYVPVIAPDEGHTNLSRVGSGPKAGGTCSRCKAGTWLKENES